MRGYPDNLPGATATGYCVERGRHRDQGPPHLLAECGDVARNVQVKGIELVQVFLEDSMSSGADLVRG